jgi:hypothetical protein
MSDRHPSPAFLITKEYRRFTEFADAVRRNRYIGLCYGPPGVGKTLSARHYSHWDTTEEYLSRLQQRAPDRLLFRAPPAGLDSGRTVFWTAPVLVTARQISGDLASWCHAVDTAIRQLPTAGWRPQRPGSFPHVELIVVDEADRLKTTGLEQVRDLYDRHRVGLVLIGMPGLERRLTRTRSCTAESDSPTNTGHWPNKNSSTCSPNTGPTSDSSCPPALSMTPTRSPRSLASPAATSD